MSADLHLCDEFCRCPEHRTPMIYSATLDEHACQDVTCEYGHGVQRALAAQEYRRSERLRKGLLALEKEVTAGLSTDEHHKVMRGGLPFCKCGFDLNGEEGRACETFITHALAVVASERARRGISPWIPADPDGLPPETYPFWRRQEMAKREVAT